MKVLHLINNLKREGAQVMVSNLVAAKNKDNVEYIICVRQPGGALTEKIKQQGVMVIEPSSYFGFRQLYKSIFFIKKACKDNHIDCIHAHMADAAVLGWIVCGQLKLPLIISHHGHDILLKCSVICRFVYYLLLNFSARYAAMNTVVSHSVSDRVRKLLFLSRAQIQVISNGVQIPDISLVRLDLYVYEAACDTVLKLVTVGRLVSLKGHKQLIQAMSQLVNRFPNIGLTIVGGGELEHELRQLTINLGLEKHIHFTGAIDQVSDILKQSDLYISTSTSEGMPVSILEAMSWCIPVIASDIPGNRSVVRPQDTGVLYELNNIGDLVSKVINVVSDRNLRVKITQRARLMVEQEYSSEVAEQAYQELYYKLDAKQVMSVT